MKKKLLTILLSVFFVINASIVNIYADWTGRGNGTQTDPWLIGEIGNESCVTAYLDANILYINGTGRMMDGVVQNKPWYSKREDINSAIISEGVTYIGKSTFRECSNLTSVSIPDSVTSFGSTLFQDCTSLTSIELPDSLEKINDSDFINTRLTSILFLQM